jgi:hypothetical protein
MSGQRTTRPDVLAAGRPSSRRVRVAAVAAALFSIAVCGAVAQATAEPGDGSSEIEAKGVGANDVEVKDAGVKSIDAQRAAGPSTTTAGDEAVPPDGLGDDPDLDALAQACFEGELAACDHLYLQSPVGSDYEAYGDTCGGRQEAGTGQWCGLSAAAEPTVPTSGEPVPPDGLGTDPALDALAQSCYAGDMAACDELYGSAEDGSEYQRYGDTCAGRQPENTGRYCTSLQDVVPGTGVTPSTTLPAPTTLPGAPTTTTTTTTVVVVTPGSTAPVSTVPGSVPPPTMEPTGLGDDPTLQPLAEACFDGDMAACDDLYRGSEPGTPYRTYGDTCAGRQPEDTGTWCVDAFSQGGTTSVVTAPTTSGLPPSTASTVVVPTPPVTSGPPSTVATVPPPTSAPVPPIDTSTTTTGVVGVIPPPTLQPTGLGTDPALDALAQSCYDGEMAACDDLWRESEAASAYRNFGDTCAGRQPPNTGIWCEDAFVAGPPTTATTVPGHTTVPGQTTIPGQTVPPTSAPSGIPPASQQPTGLGSDPALDALAQRCYDGDMQACDDLFDQAPIGSAYMTYGDTCAGRQQPGTFNYCRVVFPSAPRQ